MKQRSGPRPRATRRRFEKRQNAKNGETVNGQTHLAGEMARRRRNDGWQPLQELWYGITTMNTTAQGIELTSAVKSAVIDLLYRLGDDCLVIGHRNSEWTGLGPILEEDIAFSSMAQDQMGHAQALYTLLHELGEPAPDLLAFLRDARDFRCCQFVAIESMIDDRASAGPSESPRKVPGALGGEAPRSAARNSATLQNAQVRSSELHNATLAGAEGLCNNPDRDKLLECGDWAVTLVRQFMFAEAWSLRLAALSESAYAPLAALSRKIRSEVKYHTMHGRIWIERLGLADADARRRVQSAINRLWPMALGMFEPTSHDAALSRERIAPPEAELGERWQCDVSRRLAAAAFDVPDDVEPAHGGRTGRHGPELARLLASMQRVYRLAPGATW
jgi:phenylacetate-CoA oxygenase PaaI subunit